MCLTNDGIEDTEHFSLLLPCFDLQRQNLLPGIYALLRPLGYVNLKNEALLQLLLYGDDDFPSSLNRHILELKLQFIHKLVDLNEVLSFTLFRHKPPNFVTCHVINSIFSFP